MKTKALFLKGQKVVSTLLFTVLMVFSFFMVKTPKHAMVNKEQQIKDTTNICVDSTRIACIDL